MKMVNAFLLFAADHFQNVLGKVSWALELKHARRGRLEIASMVMLNRHFEVLELKNLVRSQQLLLLRRRRTHGSAYRMFNAAHHRLSSWITPQNWNIRSFLNAFWRSLLQALVLQRLPSVVVGSQAVWHLPMRYNSAARRLEHVLRVSCKLLILKSLELPTSHVGICGWNTPRPRNHTSTILGERRCRVVRPKDRKTGIAVSWLHLTECALRNLCITLLLCTELNEVL
jgi:hypothetical protein